MGEVYEARHRRLGKRVAVKLLPARRQASQKAVERFAREMAAVGQLDHPHLVEAHDAGEQEGIAYLVLKYVEGTDLKRLVERVGPLPVAEACELVRQASLGLQYLHERGLVHRDVKPANLMRTPEGQVKVLDLGLARWQATVQEGSELTDPDQGLGTPDYLAPEQADNATAADIRADLYGLGGTLFYLLTGRTPFAHRQGKIAKLKAHAWESPPDVRTLRPEVPAEVAALVARLLAKRPDERPGTPQELADELGLLNTAATLTVDYVPARWSRRGQHHRNWRLGLAAVAVLVLAGGTLWWQLSGAGTPGRPATDGGLLQTEVPSQPAPPGNPDRPILVRRFAVRHLVRAGMSHVLRGNLGEGSFLTHLGDDVTLSAELAEPAYCYLIAFRPDGVEEVCFPEDQTQPPPLTDRPTYPSVRTDVCYGLTDGAGLQAFFLVVSRQPLPPFDQWRRTLGPSPWLETVVLPHLLLLAPPWGHTPAALGGWVSTHPLWSASTASRSPVVWRFDGVELLPMSRDYLEGQRGMGREVLGGSIIGRLADWLRRGPDVEAVEGIGFPVLSR
jgi:hypothetical protein